MKKVAYDKSGIMKEAWDMFTRNYQICDFEYADFSGREYFEYASFTDCLKEAWAHEKEAWPGTSVWALAMRAVKLHMEIAVA